MKKHSHSLVFAAIVAVMSFLLVACDPSSFASSNYLSFPACNAANNGKARMVWVGNPKYGEVVIYGCKYGRWELSDERAACGTTGVKKGDICRRTGVTNIFSQGLGIESPVLLYVYAGHGTWKDYAPRTEIAKKCSEANEGDIAWVVFDVIPNKRDTVWYDDEPWSIYGETPGKKDTVLYECHYGEWAGFKITDDNLRDVAPGCLSENPAEGDMCSFYGKNEQQYDYRYKEGKWVVKNGVKDKCAMEGVAEGDSCSVVLRGKRLTFVYIGGKWYSNNVYETLLELPRLYKEPKGDNFYYQDGDWDLLNLVPQQDTDSRKADMTDEEYDVLDLPKEAKVGDRKGGLLEDCWNDIEFCYRDVDKGENLDAIYDYCMPRHYYLYREDGSWTLETPEEFAAYERMTPFDGRCSPELLGTRILSYGRVEGAPDEIYECIYDGSGRSLYPEYYMRVGLVFGRSAKKN